MRNKKASLEGLWQVLSLDLLPVLRFSWQVPSSFGEETAQRHPILNLHGQARVLDLQEDEWNATPVFSARQVCFPLQATLSIWKNSMTTLRLSALQVTGTIIASRLHQYPPAPMGTPAATAVRLFTISDLILLP